MSGSVNKVILVGNLGRDPEVRTMGASGGKVANLRIATSERWKDKKTGEQKDRTEWHSVSIFQEGLVSVAERFLKKGSKVYIEGQLQTRKYEKDGVEKFSTEIVLQGFGGVLTMLDGPGEGGEGSSGGRGGDSAGGGSRQGSSGGNAGGRAQTRDFDDDDVPF